MASPPEDTTTSTPRRTISREMKRKRKGTGDGKSSSMPLREEEQKHHKSETTETADFFEGSCTKKSRKTKNEKAKTCKWDLEQEVESESCLPGQRYKTLDQREPFRIFLETLYQKLPEDELPALWMMEWGLLPYDEAKKAYERNLSKKLCKMESENNEVEDTRSSSLSEKNMDFASRTVSKTKKQKTRNNSPDGAVSEPSSGRNKQKKKKHKVRD